MMVDSCYRNVPVDSRPVICPHLERVLTDSLWKVSPLEMLSPEVVCERTEAHLSELQGVARVPRVGSGRIHTFELRTVESKPPYSMRPVEVCSIFSEFHKEMATDVAAYRNRVHGDVFPSQYITKQEPRGFSVMAWLRSLGARSSARPAFGQPALWASLGPLLS